MILMLHSFFLNIQNRRAVEKDLFITIDIYKLSLHFISYLTVFSHENLKHVRYNWVIWYKKTVLVTIPIVLEYFCESLREEEEIEKKKKKERNKLEKVHSDLAW